MKQTSEAPSPSSHGSISEKPHLQISKPQCQDPIQLSSKTPEKPPVSTRTRNRGVALSVSEIRKAAKDLHDRKKLHQTTSSSEAKTARRQISLPSPRKLNLDEPLNLPEKYEVLGEFFDSMDSAIRLLRLKGSMSSFTNISPKIECLTDRRFTHSHLARLKFVLPEAIVIKKLLVFDERTRCMKPDLHVTINPDAFESDAKLPECGTLWLRKLFRARLREFCKSHPEGDDIPEETLPEPFNCPKSDPLLDMLKTPSTSFSTETLSDACEAHPQTMLSTCIQNSEITDNTDPANIEKDLSVPVKTSTEALNQQLAVASHMPPSFRRRFSSKSKENVAVNDQQKFPSKENVSVSSLMKNSIFVDTKSHPSTSQPKLASEATSSRSCPKNLASVDCITSSDVTPTTPSKTIVYVENKDKKSIDVMSPPAKLVFTPSTPVTATPALRPPKRHHMSPDDNSTSSSKKLVGRPPRRSLKYDAYDVLSDNLLHSIRQKERIAMEESNPAISLAKKRKKNIASLPKLFNMIHMLFHSRNRSIITKEELISKIISWNCDIVDRSEVEEQLHLLLEHVPEWISQTLGSSGDLLIRVNKMSNPDIVRASLEEAK